jgi:hypothetical protein
LENITWQEVDDALLKELDELMGQSRFVIDLEGVLPEVSMQGCKYCYFLSCSVVCSGCYSCYTTAYTNK